METAAITVISLPLEYGNFNLGVIDDKSKVLKSAVPENMESIPDQCSTRARTMKPEGKKDRKPEPGSNGPPIRCQKAKARNPVSQ